MSNEQDQFEKLRLLLSVKRYEQPPPGYYNRLSSDIMAQIRAGQASAAEPGIEERMSWEVPWLGRIWQLLERKPVFAGSFGVAICGLLLAGMAYYSAPNADPGITIPMAESLVNGQNPDTVVLSAQFPSAGLVAGGSVPIGSTGQVLSLAPAPLQRHPLALPVSGR
jgi:hypothetical protein